MAKLRTKKIEKDFELNESSLRFILKTGMIDELDYFFFKRILNAWPKVTLHGNKQLYYDKTKD